MRQSLKLSKNNYLLETSGGAEGNRTPGLVIANDALYQLSYGPIRSGFLPAPAAMSSDEIAGLARLPGLGHDGGKRGLPWIS